MKKIFLIYCLLCAIVEKCVAQVPTQQPYPATPAISNMAEVEAYVGNTDPGVGNGTPITIPAGVTNATATNVTLNFTAQPNGVQFLYIRSRDVLGRWSLTNYKLFTVGNFNYPTAPAVANVAEVEAYVGNTDPGVGNGTPITIPTGVTDATATNVTLNFTAQPNGVQFVYVRSRDVFGRWSLTNYKQLVVGNFNYPTAPALANVAELEYYVGNTDPGNGNGTNITIPTGTTDATVTNTPITLPVLPDGIQTLYLRSRDVFGRWSLTNYKQFITGLYNYPTAPTIPNVARVEAYVGNIDPGFGNGTRITIPTGVTDASAVNTTFNFPAQANGSQFLYIRSTDVFGRWSQTNYKLFIVGNFTYPTAPPLANIAELEYYVGNNDPGFGNGTNITIPTGVTDATATNTTITFPAQDNGVQYLYLRSRDVFGRWSETNYKQLLVGQLNYATPPNALPNIGNLEYYIDNDPGFGNAIPITFPASANVQLNNIPIPISGTLTNGAHVFHIRSKQNPWSIDNARPFNVGGVVPLTWSYITAILQNGQTLVSWATAQEINTSKFEIERSIDAVRFEKIGEQLAAGNSNTIKKYEHKDVQPAIGFNYYRIKQIDVDGRFTYSAIVKVLNTKNIKEAFIAPNPVIDMLNLVEPIAVHINTLEVYDSRGAIILRKNINSKVQLYSLPVSNLSKGNYALKVNYEKGTKSIAFVKY
jgi:Secretion system C-terminal sorting domain